jgi:hypothetical protein
MSDMALWLIHLSTFSMGSGSLNPHPEEPAEGGRLEGWVVLRLENSGNDARSPRMKASFLARLHLLSFRSFQSHP